MGKNRYAGQFFDDGMPEDERKALDAALQEALDDIEKGNVTTWDEGLDSIKARLLARLNERAA